MLMKNQIVSFDLKDKAWFGRCVPPVVERCITLVALVVAAAEHSDWIAEGEISVHYDLNQKFPNEVFQACILMLHWALLTEMLILFQIRWNNVSLHLENWDGQAMHKRVQADRMKGAPYLQKHLVSVVIVSTAALAAVLWIAVGVHMSGGHVFEIKEALQEAEGNVFSLMDAAPLVTWL